MVLRSLVLVKENAKAYGRVVPVIMGCCGLSLLESCSSRRVTPPKGFDFYFFGELSR
jgi:hypothetical protein